jgi:hypothetical protein
MNSFDILKAKIEAKMREKRGITINTPTNITDGHKVRRMKEFEENKHKF